jgi:gamma-glutamylcyclotransferase
MNRNDTGASRLVFQYGSNCLDAQINGKDRLKSDARFIGIAETVDDYELAFDVFSKGRHCAAADIVRKPGGKVWGALYEIPEYLIGRATAGAHDRKSLDAIEGEGTNYERREISVRKPDGQIVTALTYTVRNPLPDLRTDIDYVRFIIAGLRERGIPQGYIDKVKAIATANNPAIATSVERL